MDECLQSTPITDRSYYWITGSGLDPMFRNARAVFSQRFLYLSTTFLADSVMDFKQMS